MPDDESGIQLYELIKDIKPDLCRRIIIMTGDIAEPKIRQFINTNKLLYIKKPFKISEFLDTVKTAVSI
jgi:DNA-binding NarL/FixJ family response regulator